MPKVTIITVNYNNGAGLGETILSVIGQSFSDYEYIIVDGGSSDESRSIIERNAHWLSSWISEKDNGIYDAMNKGITKATGEYLMFLNSGDVMENDQVLGTFYEHEKMNGSDIYYGNIRLGYDNTSKLHTYPKCLSLDFWKSYTINHQASFIKKHLFAELGPYNISYTLAADYEFFLRSFVHGKQFIHIDHELVQFNLDGVSRDKKDLYEQQMALAWENNLPLYLKQLLKDHQAYELLMKHRLMKWAEKIVGNIKRLKSTWSK